VNVAGTGRVLASFGYEHAWVVDTEYRQLDGGLPQPHCLCALDLVTGARREVWIEKKTTCPFDMSADELFIMWAADADSLVFLAKGWSAPRHVLDPRVEFMRIRNGAPTIGARRYGLADALRHYRLPGVTEKDEFRTLAIRGGPFSLEEIEGLIAYCRHDVDATALVLASIWKDADLSNYKTFSQACWRGRFMAAVSRVEATGVPIDVALWRRFELNAPFLRGLVIEKYDQRFQVFEGGHFSHARFEKFLSREGLRATWPRTATGRASMDEETLDRMAEGRPIVADLKRFLDVLERVAKLGLTIGSDGRNRGSLFPFGAKTGRNTPSSRKHIFGHSAPFRSLIRPPRGRGVAYVDWAAQELRVAAILSGDPAMLKLCEAPDPYIALAIELGMALLGATKKSHPTARGVAKIAALAMMYGLGPKRLAQMADISVAHASAMLQRQRHSFAQYYRWSDWKARQGVAGNPLRTALGWTLQLRPGASEEGPDRTSRNFPIQGCGAEQMRLATIWATEAGFAVCAIVHDGFLIEASLDEIDAEAERMREIMERASLAIVGGRIPAEIAVVVKWPDRYFDDKDKGRFQEIVAILDEADARRENMRAVA
jgi:DNA polymerase I